MLAEDRLAGRRHPYATLEYAKSFKNAQLVDIPEWGTHALLRQIPGRELVDSVGLYPLASMSPDAEIRGGLERLRDLGAVSVVLVADPFASPPARVLEANFPIYRAFKIHHLVAPEAPLEFSQSLRRKIRLAQGNSSIRFSDVPSALGDWNRLFRSLAARHTLTGMAAFSDDAFLEMSATASMFASIVESAGEAVAMALWVQHNGVLYHHLSASSERGYKISASYALFAAVIEQYREYTIDLGGCAGIRDDPSDGLWRFKERFANKQIATFLCGKVLNEIAYANLAHGQQPTAYFPIYRAP